MKIISGYLKGRNIKGYNIIGTRPTMSRIKESVFGIIQNNVKDSIVLDLFCGSGQLGIEAISNGSKLCYFVDNNKEIIDILKDNINKLDIINKSEIIVNDYEVSLLKFSKQNIKFNLIFSDAPYKSKVNEKILELIDKYDLLLDNGLLVLEHQEILKETNISLKLIKNKKYGDKFINIYQK